MKQHHQATAENWQAVLDIDAKLASLDPAATDREGIAARARLELLYEEARHAEGTGDHAAAGRRYAEILRTDPGFRDAASRRGILPFYHKSSGETAAANDADDIELETGSGSGPGEYTVRVIRSPAGGETSAGFRLDVDAILDRLPELEAVVLASAVPARATIPVAEKTLREVGQQLFQALFTGAVKGTYRASLGAAQQFGHRLRVVLRLAAPELAALPWELLFDPDAGSYVCQDMPLLRRIPAADYNPRPLEVVPPLRILGIVAAPHDLPGLDAEAEKQHLTDALAEPVAAGLVELVWADEATWTGIQTSLLAGPWQVLHFIGHGDYDTNRQEGRIALESNTGRTDMVESSRLMHLLREAEPTPRLVVLNSCSSRQAGQQNLFSRTAAALVHGGISAVAAMQFAISDASAIAFARGFYSAIAHGRNIDKATGSGRRSIMGLGTLEWVTPVLYVRGSTRLFTISSSEIP